MFNEVITLLAETETVDEYGDIERQTTEKQIFAETQSIGQSEFYQAQAVGFQPEIKFVIADYLDYGGEKRLKYTPYGGTEQVYEILRTYRNKNNLEIVCKRGVDE